MNENGVGTLIVTITTSRKGFALTPCDLQQLKKGIRQHINPSDLSTIKKASFTLAEHDLPPD